MNVTTHMIELGKASEKLRRILNFVPDGALRDEAEELLENGIYDYSRAIVEIAEDAIKEDMKNGLF